jgi:hypothetical protein
VAVVSVAASAQAQSIIMEQDVNADTAISTIGPNRKSFTSNFFDLSFPVGDFEGANGSRSMVVGKSWSFAYGLNHKIRINNFYSLLGQLSYSRSAYFSKVEAPVLSDKLILNDLNVEFSNRFNFGKRGDVVGTYLELGVSAAYTFMSKQKTTIESPDSVDSYSIMKTSLHGIDIIEPIHYNAHVRVGSNKWVLFATYMLTDKLKPESTYQLPPLKVGLRIDIGA